MSSSVIACPGCGYSSNLEVAGPICWKCGRQFTEQDFADRDSRENAKSAITVPVPAPAIHAPNTGALETIGGILGVSVVLIPLIFLLSWCTSDPPPPSAAEVVRANATPSPLEAATHQVTELSERFARASSTCEHGAVRIDSDGKLALAEVDLAMADSMDSITPDQEQRIRESIGSEMGLAPSQVDGWRSIYQSRAEQAKRLLAQADEGEKRRQQLACTERPELKESLVRAETTLARLKPAASPREPK